MALPSIGLTGLYVVKAPFVVKDGVSYKCTGIVSFDAAEKNGIDVLAAVFVANGLTLDDYNASKASGASLVTIEDGFADIVTLTDDYIASIPVGEGVKYSDNVITLELGQLPEGFDLTTLVENLVQRCKGFTGVECVPVEHKFPITDFVSKDQHAAFEKAREANVIYDKPDCGKLADAQETINGLRTRVHSLEQIILTHYTA